MKKLIFVSVLLLAAGLFTTGFAIKKAEAAEEKAKPQTICPVMGDPINKQYYVDYKGYRIYFCCKDCPETFKENPEKYMKILKESGVKLDKAPTGEGEKETEDHSKHEHNH
ncbi:MAG: hypothetical protein A2176_08105 [Spirochaetes bacterium RBG_13_51_14]|nr:MAG: hypothetical protein A2176_08105 [Spirochaetes bacterium RBG_13_51_14]